MKLSRKDLLDTIVPGFLIDVNKNNRFYVNPSTGRTIKSGSKTFKSLKQKKIKINKHRCLYDINSAKQCLKNILNKYAGIYPPSSFINIPLTLDKRGELDYIRAFIRDKDLLKGFIKKDGSLYKFRKNIKFDKNKKYPIVKYASKNDNKKLLEKLDSEGIKVTKKIQKKINKFIYDVNPRCDTINILYNPIQQDFIPINEKKGKMPFSDRKKILDEINNTLIPSKLQGVFDSSISGILKSSKNENNILGYVDDKNNIKLFKEPVEIILQKENKENKENKTKKLKLK